MSSSFMLTNKTRIGYCWVMVSLIDDPIEVLAHFSKTRLRPLRFLWRGQSYKVDAITSEFHTKNGTIVNHCFAAQSGATVYELSYNPHDYSWKLTRVFTEG